MKCQTNEVLVRGFSPNAPKSFDNRNHQSTGSTEAGPSAINNLGRKEAGQAPLRILKPGELGGSMFQTPKIQREFPRISGSVSEKIATAFYQRTKRDSRGDVYISNQQVQACK